MGIINSNKYPIPNSWDEFEDMVYDIFRFQHPYMSVNRYGRQGQKQDGIDILVYNNEFKHGIQCKNIKSFAKSDIDKIINEIKIDIDMFTIAVTTPRDVKTIQYALKKSQEIKKIVNILYWEDIINHLSSYNLLQKYYPEFFMDNFQSKKDRELFENFYKDFNDSGLRGYLQNLQANYKINDEAMSLFFFLTEKWSQIDYMFHNKEVEESRKVFIDGIEELSTIISLQTWSCEPGLHSIPPEWMTEQPERYLEAVESINMQLALFDRNFNNMILIAKIKGIY